MTKFELITSISRKTGLEKKEAQTIVESFFEVIKDAVSQKKTIYLRGFGSFHPQLRLQKKARNIIKNKTVLVEPYYRPKFKPSKFFVEKIKTANLDLE